MAAMVGRGGGVGAAFVGVAAARGAAWWAGEQAWAHVCRIRRREGGGDGRAGRGEMAESGRQRAESGRGTLATKCSRPLRGGAGFGWECADDRGMEVSVVRMQHETW